MSVTSERTNKVVFSESIYESDVFIWKRKDYEINDFTRVIVKEDDISHSIAKELYPNNRYVYYHSYQISINY